MAVEELGANPSGATGRILGMLMNLFSTPVYARYLGERLPPDGSTIVDLGCGGGGVIRYLSERNFDVVGIDHSPQMVRLSRRINRRRLRLENSNVRILRASVMEIPLEDGQADLVTAFDTINFWPEIQKPFFEVLRILKNGGRFLILNGYPSEGSRWWRIARLKSDEEYVAALCGAGFREAAADLNYKRGWIAAAAAK